jgi:hypothetical protein
VVSLDGRAHLAEVTLIFKCGIGRVCHKSFPSLAALLEHLCGTHYNTRVYIEPGILRNIAAQALERGL